MDNELYFYPSEEFRLGEYKGIPLLYYEGYKKYRNNYFNSIFESFGLKKYYLRHGDDGNWVLPVTIENQFVWVNYCGCIFTFEDLTRYMTIERRRHNKDNVFIEFINHGFIELSEDEAYDVIGTDEEVIEFLDFINNYNKILEGSDSY